MKLSQRPGVAVVLNNHRKTRKSLREPRLQRHFMPPRQMRRIEQQPFLDPERPTN